MVRRRTDAVLVAVLRAATAFADAFPRAGRVGLGLLGAMIATLAWPFEGSLRRRVAAAGLRVWPWVRGWCLGVGLADMLVPDWTPEHTGVDLMVGRPGIMLTGHLGSWEAGGNTLRKHGIELLVLSSPWPRLPRTEAEVARLRMRRGIPTVSRGRDAWPVVADHLARGGVVAGLIDSIGTRREGRRAHPFPGGAVGAPDSLVRFAREQGVELWVATGDRRGFEVRAIPPGSDEERADFAVQAMADAVRRAPSAWAWVAPLSALALMTACAPERVPPLPTDPEAWVADVVDLRWKGELDDGTAGTLQAASASVRWRDGGPDGQFRDVRLSLKRPDPDWPAAELTADRGAGRWPEGPFVLHGVRWAVDNHGDGATDRLDWSPDGRWSCGGCPLEALIAEAAP